MIYAWEEFYRQIHIIVNTKNIKVTTCRHKGIQRQFRDGFPGNGFLFLFILNLLF